MFRSSKSLAFLGLVHWERLATGGGIYSSNLPSPGGGRKIFVPLAQKWGRIFVPGDFYANIDKIKDYFLILLNF